MLTERPAAKPAYLLQIPMQHSVWDNYLTLMPRPDKPGNALAQFEAAIAAIVTRERAQAIEEDRARWGRGAPGAEPTSKDGLEECPRCRGRGSSCTLCSGCGIMFTEVVAQGGQAAEPTPTPSDPPPVATMPAFPMSKQVEPDRVVLVREPRETGSAWEQFERTLKGYLERHATRCEIERIVYRDCPCPTCTGDDDDGDEEGDGQPTPIVPTPPFLTAIFAAVAAELTAGDTAAEIAHALVGRMRAGDVEAIDFALATLAEMGGGEGSR